ncbi:MAG TPA: Ig-like domain-containing protein, partial [Verrucomicrobiae bacterium]|nr:Ig-like domain-containing protein [Verrucomicrobiae bacterium]
MKIYLRVLAIFLFAFLPILAAQAQPANNNFANAWFLNGTSVTTNGSNVNATKETGEPNHAGNAGGRSVWFVWTAPVSGQTRIDTIGSSFNTLLAVYTGTAVNALTTIAANNDIGGGTNSSLLQFQAVQGTTYHIAVDANRNFGTPTGGNYLLHLQVLASVNITSPTNGAIFQHGASIPLTVTVSFVPSPPVTRVEMYTSYGPTGIVGTNTTAPYDFRASNAPLGTNYFAALVYDSAGGVYQTPVMSVVVLDQGVTILSPLDGTTYANTNPIPVSAAVFLPAGFTMTELDFYVDGQKFGQVANSPWTAVWSNVVAGAHKFTITGHDSDGGSYLSAPV